VIEITELYGGEIICEFNSAKHTYTIVNKGRRYKVPSVTGICSIINKPALVPWAVNQTLDVVKGAIAPGCEYAEVYLEAVWDAAKRTSQRIKSEAASKGTEAHKRIEEIFKYGSEEQRSGYFGQGLVFLSNFRTVETERRIYSRRYRFSGTLDVVIRNDAGLFLIDWKTSKSIYPEFRLQTAAYVAAYEEEFPDQKIEGRYLVRITEDGQVEPHFYPRSTLRLDFKAFLGAKALHDRIQQITKKINS
jgi:hypothetical protein